MLSITEFPFIYGLAGIIQNGKDPRRDLLYILAGGMILLVLLEAIGYPTGTAGMALIAAFSTLVGYFVRSKEEEIKKE